MRNVILAPVYIIRKNDYCQAPTVVIFPYKEIKEMKDKRSAFCLAAKCASY